MKSLFFVLYLLLATPLVAEQRVVLVKYSTWSSNELREIDQLLKLGWRVVSVAGAGGEDSKLFIFVLERDENKIPVE